MKTLFHLSAAVILTLASASAALSEPRSAKSEYKISIHGITLARMSFVTQIDNDNYTISGSVKSSALGDIVGKTRGQTKVVGKVSPTHLQARTYSINYTTGKKSRAFNVEFDPNGKVKSTKISPAPRTPTADWVKLNKKDLISVVDPISSLTFPLNSPVCSRTVSIFDGETLLDLKLSPKGHRRFKTKGFKGRAVVCNVRFYPKGGYRSGHSSIKYLQNSKKMEVWFGKSEALQAYVPVFAKIPTKIGNVRIWATRIGS